MSEEMDFAQLVAQEDEIKILLAECAELRGRIEQLETELQQARQTAEFWKAEHLSGNKLIDELRAKIAALEAEQRPMSLDELHEQGLVSRYDMISEANNYRG